MPKAVIFDVDGTLIDTVGLHAQAWADTFRKYGVKVSVEKVRGQIGTGGDQLMPEFLDSETIERQGEEIEKARSRAGAVPEDPVDGQQNCARLLMQGRRARRIHGSGRNS